MPSTADCLALLENPPTHSQRSLPFNSPFYETPEEPMQVEAAQVSAISGRPKPSDTAAA